MDWHRRPIQGPGRHDAIRLLDADALPMTCGPAEPESGVAYRYIAALVRRGPSAYIQNVTARPMALQVGERIVPVVVAGGNNRDSNVCSPYTHYVAYAAEELRKLRDGPLQWLLKSCFLALGPFMRAGRTDRVVYLNNWLFPTNPWPGLSSEHLAAATSLLSARFPDHAVVVRSVNTRLYDQAFQSLRDVGYRMVRSRRVYVLDPTSRAYAANTNVKRDRRLLQESGYQVVDTDGLSAADAPRLTQLFRGLYLEKHSYFNPQLTPAFFALMLTGRVLSFKALRKHGRIDAFICYLARNGVMTGVFIGYDTRLPLSAGLYRQAIALMMAEAERTGHVLHLSAGAGAFKLFRAADPCTEYDAVYDRHLPLCRRLAWHCLKSVLDGWERVVPYVSGGRRALT